MLFKASIISESFSTISLSFRVIIYIPHKYFIKQRWLGTFLNEFIITYIAFIWSNSIWISCEVVHGKLLFCIWFFALATFPLKVFLSKKILSHRRFSPSVNRPLVKIHLIFLTVLLWLNVNFFCEDTCG